VVKNWLVLVEAGIKLEAHGVIHGILFPYRLGAASPGWKMGGVLLMMCSKLLSPEALF